MTSSRADLSRISERHKGSAERRRRGRGGTRTRSASSAGRLRAGEEARTPGTGERLLLSGSYAQIRADASWLGEHGVTELFYDLNWDPLIGSPDVDHEAATARAAEIMAALAPDP